MEPDHRGRSKKLIWALETQSYEEFGRPSCGTCSDALRAKRGCFKPGFKVQGSSTFKFYSPRLAKEHKTLQECPVGAVLREAPYVYDAIAAEGYVQSGALNPLEQTRWLEQAMRVVSIERGRIQENKDMLGQGATDAAFGAAVLKGRKP